MRRSDTPASLAGAVALAAVLAVWAPVQGQEGQQEQAGPPTLPSGELVFEREVFQYPTFERRNPFRSLGRAGDGPRFESMMLRGIIYDSSDASQSMALLGSGRGEDVRTQALRSGETWGNVRVLEIRRTEVLVEIQEFGLTEQRIMELPTRRQGGS